MTEQASSGTAPFGSAACHQGMRVLLVEDQYVIAVELCGMLEQLGAVVEGPYGDLATAMAWPGECDVALLDVNLRDVAVFPLAERLLSRNVPVAMVTGYDQGVLPAKFAELPRLSKPVEIGLLAALLARMMAAQKEPC